MKMTTFRYERPTVEDHHRFCANKNGEDVAILLREVDEGAREVSDIEIWEGAYPAKARRPGREVAGSD